ncbi:MULTISPECIES: PucR family transcriptional regulator [unclassified Streptomyces]|uniref:PucR family transcriptional regulator n=1 Tax=unclassified Streptomyces TaxID=2593676 RepID=UPI000DC39C2D|nr:MULTISPECIES: PucR family transcriptional regulator [unclassified Streptomyces]RAJ75371.1 DNA-binding PucR family transcriptional regulator [Streptomyces sp. PsTaAH-137]
MAMAQDEARLRRHLASALLDDIDGITGRLVSDICAHSALYASGRPVPLADLRAICRDNLVLVIQDFGRLPAGAADFTAAATETGRRRAGQGMPLDNVLMAYRRGGRVLWQAMTEPLRGRPASEQDLALEVAGALWETIDRFSTVMSDAYRLAQLELQHRRESRRGAFFEALLEGRGGDPAVAAAASTALGIPVNDCYVVVVIDQNPADPAAPEPVLQEADLWSFWRTRAARSTGLVRLASFDSAKPAAVLRDARLGAVGMSPPFRSIADADTALRLAERALSTVFPHSGEVAELDERLVEAMLTHDAEIADRILARYLGGVPECGADGVLLMETLATWLATGCSAPRTAERLYCHRNTILNRLERISEITGWSIESGEARLGWALALRAARVPR